VRIFGEERVDIIGVDIAQGIEAPKLLCHIMRQAYGTILHSTLWGTLTMLNIPSEELFGKVILVNLDVMFDSLSIRVVRKRENR
jgi:hypothetical protein